MAETLQGSAIEPSQSGILYVCDDQLSAHEAKVRRGKSADVGEDLAHVA